MLNLTDNFLVQKENRNYSPVFLVEMAGLGKFYGSREPGFTGVWLAGTDLIATPYILAGADIGAYTTVLHQLRNSGLGTITYQLDDKGLGTVGAGAIQFLNQGGLSLELQELLLENNTVLIRLGFLGLEREDYATVFRGIVDKHSATFEAFNLDLVDDTLKQLTPGPPQIGTDVFPRAFTQGSAVPIILGEARDVPVIQLVGPVQTLLAFDITSASTLILTTNPNAAYPPKGSITLTGLAGSETVTYTAVNRTVENNITYNEFVLGTHIVGAFTAGATVDLSVLDYQYLLGFSAKNVRKVRANGAAPTSAPTIRNRPLDPTGGDPRKVTTIEFPNPETSVTATVSSVNRGDNLFLTDAAEPATFGDGGWDYEVPAGRQETVLKGVINDSQHTNSDAYIDVAVEIGHTYRVSATAENLDALYVAVTMGTEIAPAAYFSFSEVTGATEQTFDLDFTATRATFRLGFLIGNVGSPYPEQTVYFSNFDLYDVQSENPALQIGDLIRDHMPNIQPDPESFDEAFLLWDDAGDRMSGIIQQTEEQQALLGRLANQFRARTFLNEQGRQKLVVFDQSRIPVYDFQTRDVYKGSMAVTKSPLSEIYTNVYVYYGRSAAGSNAQDLGGREAFTGVVFASPGKTNHVTEAGLGELCQRARDRFKLDRTVEVFCDLIFDSGTASNLLSYLVKRLTHQRTICQFTSYLRGIHVEIGDFVRVSHPLLPAASQFGHFDVVSKELDPNGCFVKFQVEEINPFLFGGFLEHWEPPRAGFPARVFYESWDYQTVFAARQALDEHWENFVQDANDGFDRLTPKRLSHNVKFVLTQNVDGAVVGPGQPWGTDDADGAGSGYTGGGLPGVRRDSLSLPNSWRVGAQLQEYEVGGTGDFENRGNNNLDTFLFCTVSDPLASDLLSNPHIVPHIGGQLGGLNGEVAFQSLSDLYTRLVQQDVSGPEAVIDMGSNWSIRATFHILGTDFGFGASVGVPTASSFSPILNIYGPNPAVEGQYGQHLLLGIDGKSGLDALTMRVKHGQFDEINRYHPTAAGGPSDAFSGLGVVSQAIVTWNVLTQEMSLTLDAEPTVTETISAPLAFPSTNWRIGHTGRIPGFAGVYGWWMRGSIGEVTMWTRVLTRDEIEFLNTQKGVRFPYDGA